VTATADPAPPPATTDGSGVPFPGSRKTYLQGSRPDLRVPDARGAAQHRRQRRPLRHERAVHRQHAAHRHPVRAARTREAWIAERGDTETYAGPPVQPVDNGLKAHDHRNLDSVFAGTAQPAARCRAGPVTQLAYARRGDITPEMEFIALREGCTPSTCATRWPAAAPSCR
jgi:phosphomethylpyrimidine synthase